MKINIIGDIHGRYQALLELIEKMPKASKNICVGDLIDKGKHSISVMNFFLKNKNFVSILGNHEVLFIASNKMVHKDLQYLKLIKRNEFRNKYLAFTKGIRQEIFDAYPENEEKRKKVFSYISNWFNTFELDIKIDNLYISHSPFNSFTKQNDEMKNYKDNFNKIFIKRNPIPIKDKFAIFGHLEKPRYWYKETQERLKVKEIEKSTGKGKKGEAICVDGAPNYLIGINIDTITLDYKIFVVDGSKEWNHDLGSKYIFNQTKKRNIEKMLQKWDTNNEN